MVNFQLMSDVHCEHHMDGGRGLIDSIEPAAENLIIAGDLTNFRMLERVLNALAKKYRTVVFIPGNHEYYGAYVTSVDYSLPNFDSNVFVLVNKNIVIDGVKISGTTLWFPWSNDLIWYRDMMSDFHVIEGFEPWVYEENEKARGFIKDNYDSDIIVTHHLPSGSLIDSHFKGSQLNRFFVDPMLDNQYDWECRAKYWLFGHTHSSNDTMLGDTRCISNPFGYPHALNPNFDPQLVITL